MALMQSFSAVSGLVWIGLNSNVAPGTQQWQWVGGENYDPAVQACASKCYSNLRHRVLFRMSLATRRPLHHWIQ